MMRRIGFMALLFLLPAFGSAEPQTISFNIETSIDPIAGVGLLMKQNGVVQKPDVKFSRLEKGLWKASFVIDSAEAEEASFASALLVSSDGDIASSNVKALREALSPSVPKCAPAAAASVPQDSQVGALQSLVQVRSARRDNAQARVVEMMKGEFLETLRKLEKGFGLSQSKELGPSLPPVELIDRLDRIKNAIKNYRTVKPDAK